MGHPQNHRFLYSFEGHPWVIWGTPMNGKPPGDRQVYQVLRAAPSSTSGSRAPCSPRAACARPPPPALRALAPAQPCQSRRWRSATGAGCLTRNCSLAKFQRICWKPMAFTIQIAQVAEYEQTVPTQQLPQRLGGDSTPDLYQKDILALQPDNEKNKIFL